MILCEFTPEGGDMIRIAARELSLTNPWYGYILSIDSLKFELSSPAGGFVKPTFSNISLSPEMFENLTWPPAYNADIVIKWTEDTEANAVLLFSGTATLDQFDRESIDYNVQMDEFDLTIEETYPTYNDTLVNVFSGLCTSLSLTLNSDLARVTSPAVNYTPDSDQQAIELMSDMAEFFTHGFYVEDGVLHLVDMLASDTAIELTEYDFTPATYRANPPISLVKCNTKSAPGSNPNGEEIDVGDRFSDGGATLVANLENFVTCVERNIAEITCPITNQTPQILDYVTLYDESTVQPTTFTGRVVSALYNFESELVQLEISGVAT